MIREEKKYQLIQENQRVNLKKVNMFEKQF